MNWTQYKFRPILEFFLNKISATEHDNDAIGISKNFVNQISNDTNYRPLK